MSIIYRYKTVEKEAEAEIVEKKSRFIASVSSIREESEAIAFIESIKKKHYNARHNVYAYITGIERNTPRYSDDGEPPGTGGIPILNILTNENIVNTIVVVTRYFGGTLLGTGGLVRAYSEAAKKGLLAANVIEKVLYNVVIIRVDYSLIGKIEYEILSLGNIIENTEYAQTVEFSVLVEYELTESFVKHINNVTNAVAKISIKEQKYKNK